MGTPIDYAPIAATAFAIPQFLPQIIKLRRTDDTAGVSWPWATLTSANNAAWLAYFTLSAYWTALVPASSATLLAGALATMLARRGQATARTAALVGAWAALLTAAFAVAGRTGLGTLLTAAFVLQVTPSIWTAYRQLAPPESPREPGSSSSASWHAGRPSASTSPIRVSSSSASPGSLQAFSCSPGSAAQPQSDDQQRLRRAI
jgi:uncharacterized protein with PQ loop repeat